MATVTDPRHADLYASVAAFLTEYRLHPYPASCLAHGYVDLCLAAWPGARGAQLDLATRWALWTWTADDYLDDGLRSADRDEIHALYRDLLAAPIDGARLTTGHPLALALTELCRDTCAMMTAQWWERYRRHLFAWLDAAADKLTDFLQPHRTPTLREYLALRPTDGGMVLAAMWCELAEQCVTPDWNDPLVRSLVAAFSSVGFLTNDLAAPDTDTFTAIAALAASQGLPPTEARQEALALLAAEERRFWWLYTAVRDDELDPATVQFARSLDRFRYALTAWTRASTRYALIEPQVAR
ncbi:hypothetical protein OG500_28680 [Kitasatospora sp. NBC_01250]|uniref:terpene synthase family protein n=1 Tax=Kitasatospora sp. NBC_01250 TaxID=2903571 RepID=UPI002E34DEF5|nr:hypothetical protein [Kitasatospora sp. NBC_01250]